MYPSARPLCPGLEEMAASNRPLLNICKCVCKGKWYVCVCVWVMESKEREKRKWIRISLVIELICCTPCTVSIVLSNEEFHAPKNKGMLSYAKGVIKKEIVPL